MQILFVAGVHGVGKTTACAEVAARLYGEHYTASGLIKSAKASAIATTGKLVADVDGNQELLISSFKEKVIRAKGQIILLDGHSALRDASNAIQRLPVSVFRSLGVTKIVCFSDSPEAIAARMQARDNAETKAAEIAELQEAELAQASSVAEQLGVPFSRLQAFDVEGLYREAS